MPHAHTAGERRSGRCVWWMVVVCAMVVLAIGGGGHLVAAAGQVPRLANYQEGRGFTTAIDHHSFTPPLLRYYYGDGEIPHWQLSGSTVITDHYVRLTGDEKSQVGHLWNTEPLDMNAFEVVVGFRVVRPQGGLGADGFSVWVADPPLQDGSVLGRSSTFKGFGILFDSYDNDNRRDNPMVSLIVNDGSSKKRFDVNNDFMGDIAASCVFDYINVGGSNMATMRMLYQGGDLRVFLSVDSEATETACFSVTSLPMPDDAYLSISGQTGGVSEIHDIIFVHLSPLEDEKYDHDVHETVLPPSDIYDAQIYNNEAMNNRPRPNDQEAIHPLTAAPQHPEQQSQPPPQQPQQPQHPEQQSQPPPQQPQQPQHHGQQSQPPPQQPQQPQHPGQQSQPPPQQPQQPQHHGQQSQPPPQHPQQPQHPEQQSQPPPQQPQQPQHHGQQPSQVPAGAATDEQQRIQDLENKLAELQRRRSRRSARRVQEDEEYGYAEDDEGKDFLDEDDKAQRARRLRRARTPRRNRDEYDD
ncbi:hypothetical protein JKF63_06258 [Porcisia hertigi]|uniref:L-type lectin-like domain-containing protein n=1 Tax=Porcisia hertigi TaxID=2761500 RepID=A0A836IU92_9TRYP|nr:hypothetical protein JKF63_06258 [Porcisia hertigi]